MEKEEHVPENAIFCCFGCMSSAGTLTGVVALEAYKRLDKEKKVAEIIRLCEGENSME